jgi:hypothetical protein
MCAKGDHTGSHARPTSRNQRAFKINLGGGKSGRQIIALFPSAIVSKKLTKG